MEWKIEYSVGDEELDRDHMTIFNAVDRVKKAQKNGFADDFISILLNQLLEYVDGHFTKEEDYMADISYPDLPAHRDRHVEMKAELVRLRNQFVHDSQSNLDELVPFLSDWWETHILVADMAYKKYGEDKQ
ncbi:MAG: hemerythrin family protein [Rhodospirillaceae bacterium]|jgi:hemerythrin|nr:hemerythrin family protein [Rhodospirillaceae bacterium]MBT4590283.1 hemerythrin family protein [Rhodospirillaceae bacterium]MBT4939251.1 hemerythrin family protein [Rhodospirillaceae bacterium]MBT7265929.1 hemerythrin family protein [Rhodospirillaceae bacterium]